MKTTQKLQKGLSIVLTLMMLVQVASPISYAQESMQESDLIKGGVIIDDNSMMMRPIDPEYNRREGVESTAFLESGLRTINARATRLKLREQYEENKESDGEVSISYALITALQMQAMQNIGGRCEKLSASANQVMRLEKASAEQATVPAEVPAAVPAMSTFQVKQEAQVASTIPAICLELFYDESPDGQEEPSNELLKLFSVGAALFFSDLDFVTFIDQVMQEEEEDRDAYIQSELGAGAGSILENYILSGQMPTEDGGFTPTTECKQNIIILKTNLLQLEDKEATSSLEYARIETQLQNLKQDPTCTIQERPRALAIQTTTKSPSIRSEVISFAVPALTVPTNTNDFCTTTAFTLQSQLDTLGSRQIPVLQKLNQSIDKLKGAEKINESQRDLASLFQNVAAESLTKAWTALGGFNASVALDNLLTMTANLANMFTTADAGYKIMDGLVPDIGKYRDAMRQTSLADIFNNSVETFNEVMARPTDLVWDNDNGQFQERKTNRPGITMTLNDGWSAAITQASAREFRESYTEQSWTKSYLTRALTVGELTQIYFGNVDRNTISQDMQNLMQDRYTTIYSIDSKNLPDELYTRVLRSSRNYGSFGSFDSSMVFMTLMAVNNEFYAVLLDEKNNNVDLVPAGTYNGPNMQINVGTDGRATATSTTTSTFPESIQASIQKDGKTLMAMKGKVTWPTTLPSFKQEEQSFTQELIKESRTAQFNMVGMADTVEYTEGEMVKVPMIRANIPTIGQDRVINAATTASSAVKRERELALPTAITISLYLKPINININLARVHNNGTNTITLNATVTGPSICNAKIGASVSYRGDEYGIPTQQDVSDIKGEEQSDSLPLNITVASLNLDINSHAFNASIPNPEELLNALFEGDEIASIFNNSVTATFAALGQSIGSLSLTSDNDLLINYANGTTANFIDMLFEKIDTITLGWLEKLVGEFNGGGDSLWVNNANYNLDKDAGQYTFSIEYADNSNNSITVDNAQVMVEDCDNNEGCTSNSYPLQQQPDGRYTVVISTDQIDKFNPRDGGSQTVYAEASYNGMSTNYQFFNRSFDKVSEQGLSVENYSYNPSQDENQQPTYDFFIQYGDKQGSSNISVDSAELRVRNCDNMSGCTEASYFMNRGGDGYRLTLPAADIDGYNPTNGGSQEVYAQASYNGTSISHQFINRAFMGAFLQPQ